MQDFTKLRAWQRAHRLGYLTADVAAAFEIELESLRRMLVVLIQRMTEAADPNAWKPKA